MNRGVIKTVIQAAGFGTDTDSTTAQDRAIDAALLELSAEADWTWLRKTATGTLTVTTPYVPIPSDYGGSVLGVRITLNNVGYEPLVEISTDAIQRFLHLDATGTTAVPNYWGLTHLGEPVVWPRPNAAYSYTLDYVAEPTTTSFDADAESGPWHRRHDVLIAWMAIRWLAVRKRDWALKAVATEEANQARLNIRRAERRGQDDGHVTPWAGWGLLNTGR